MHRLLTMTLAAGSAALLAGCSASQTTPSAATTNTGADGASPSVYQLPDWSGAWSADGTGSVAGAIPDAAARPNSTVKLTPQYQALRAAAVAKHGTGAIFGIGGGRMARCLPSGMPGIMNHGVAFEFIFSPGRVTLLFEDGAVRRIHTDGREHPDKSEWYLDIMGHSTGRWEADNLVVDTVGMAKEAELFLANGMTVTPATRVSERFYRKPDNAQRLYIDTVVEDPEVFTEPYRYTRWYDMYGPADFQPGCKEFSHDNETSTGLDLTPPKFEELTP
jgi:hypothetical protein